ncbi:MAG TPA: DUF4292 domain-containing protein [Chitinophagaceae bacterium]|nr:DUF4292 domain-containing protein [Chitinophagaceae bacterium]
MIRIISIIILAGLLASCSSTKKISTAIAKKDTLQLPVGKTEMGKDSDVFINNTLQQINANHIDFTTFSSKVNIDYKDDAGKNYDVNAVIRMYKDSAVWISANAVLGIEALRVLITGDSVKLLNKLDKTYTARSMDYLQEVTSLPLDLKILQDLLIGNPVYLDSNIISYSNRDNTISLLSVGEWFKNLLTVNGRDKSLQRSKLDDADIVRNRTAELNYSDYETKKNILFATKRRINISEKKKLDIKLEFKQLNFNEEVSFPFSIPKNYKLN